MYELTNVTRAFRQADTTIRAVDGLDLSIEAGEFLVIEGASGSGKTTLLQLLGGLDRPTSGSVMFEGEDLGKVADRKLADLRLRAFGFVFQQFNLIPTLSAQENVEAALAPTGINADARRERAKALLAEVGLEQRTDHIPPRLSGGEQQRVAIARALANDPRVILADEPTGNLDSRTGREIVELLAGLSQEHGQTVVLVTHDATISARATRLLQMRDGAVVTEHTKSLMQDSFRRESATIASNATEE
ncbi:MAG: ABC transporter ATP-binding protein [Actinomycetota bacterium]